MRMGRMRESKRAPCRCLLSSMRQSRSLLNSHENGVRQSNWQSSVQNAKQKRKWEREMTDWLAGECWAGKHLRCVCECVSQPKKFRQNLDSRSCPDFHFWSATNVWLTDWTKFLRWSCSTGFLSFLFYPLSTQTVLARSRTFVMHFQLVHLVKCHCGCARKSWPKKRSAARRGGKSKIR